MRAALNKSQEYENLFQTLGNDPQTKLFDTMKDVFMFALILGYLNNHKKPFSKQGGEPIRFSVFNDVDRNIMDIIALSYKNELEILVNEEENIAEKYQLIEYYTNGGMEILSNNICKPVPNYANLKKLIDSYNSNSEEPKREDISDLLNGIKI